MEKKGLKAFKRFAAMFLAVIILVTSLNVTEITSDAANTTSMKISGHTTISTVDTGSYKTVNGTITSNYDFTYINGYILKSDHKTIVYQGSATSAELKKNKRKYTLANSNVDKKLLFNKLPAGTYYLKITAKNTKEKAVALVDYKFTVQAKSTLKISSATKPSSLTQGSYFDLKGTISSNYNITYVTGQILKSDGKTAVYSKTVQPNKKSFSLYSSAVDKSLSFNKLSTGTYYYKLSAKDSSGKRLDLINQKFTVTAKKSSSTSSSTVKVSSAQYYNGKAGKSGAEKTISNISVLPTSGYCACGKAIGQKGHYCCWNYASKVYKYIWGRELGSDQLNAKSNNYLNALNMTSLNDRRLTVANLQKVFSKAPRGAALRISKASDINNWNQNSSGHSMIFVGLNSTGDGAWFIEGNHDGKGNVRLVNWKWKDLVKTYDDSKQTYYAPYIKYVVWPGGGTK